MNTLVMITTAFILFVYTEQAWSEQIIKTKIGDEAVSALAVTTGSAAPGQIFSNCIPLQPGKTADVRVQSELTNNLGYTVGIGYAIKVWDYSVVNGSSTSVGVYDLTPPVMSNVTPDLHHFVINTNGIETMAKNNGANTRCYTLSVWAVSSSAKPGAMVTVEKGYGLLTISVR